mgnify:CR=1 FL=1
MLRAVTLNFRTHDESAGIRRIARLLSDALDPPRPVAHPHPPLTEELAMRKARVIAFDILFPEHDRVSPETFVALYPELAPGAAAVGAAPTSSARAVAISSGRECSSRLSAPAKMDSLVWSLTQTT